MKSEKETASVQKQNILEQRARSLAKLPEKRVESGEALELITFHLGSQYIGIPTSLVYETQPINLLKWAVLPTTPPFIIGVVNLRGHIYSVMDLAQFVGLPGRPLSEKTHILLISGGICSDGKEMELTILTDDVPQVRTVILSQLNPPPATIFHQLRDYIRGITPDMLLVFDMQRLLSGPRLIIKDTD